MHRAAACTRLALAWALPAADLPGCQLGDNVVACPDLLETARWDPMLGGACTAAPY